MAGIKVTEHQTAQQLQSDAYMLVTQAETVNGETKTVLRRVPVSALSDSLSIDHATVADVKAYLGIS